MRRLGIEPRTAHGQLQHLQETAIETVPLPPAPSAAPYRVTSAGLGLPANSGSTVFHVIGDSGGVKDPNPQIAVANALVADLVAHPEVAFLDHVGDVDYFNGEPREYGPQFYEPYAQYLRHILAIPGNHDGDSLPGEQSLASFILNFCNNVPHLLPEWEEYGRSTMTLPNVYWTLEDENFTLISLYSNVPSGGVIEADQAAWFEDELRAARPHVPVIVQLHHPPYSIDAHHGGSAKMGEVIDKAAEAAQRWPALVLAGHVHDYQRFTRAIKGTTAVAYIVCGAGGYHNLHGFAPGAGPGEQVAEDVVYEAGQDKVFGFLRLAIGGGKIEGEYVGVSKEGQVTPALDTFTMAVG
jgi:acid phosphatase type 7